MYAVAIATPARTDGWRKPIAIKVQLSASGSHMIATTRDNQNVRTGKSTTHTPPGFPRRRQPGALEIAMDFLCFEVDITCSKIAWNLVAAPLDEAAYDKALVVELTRASVRSLSNAQQAKRPVAEQGLASPTPAVWTPVRR
jgi:hypothetical protein